MDKELLKRILTDNNRVVLPNFGAFLRKQQGEGLVFSPFLKSDDGVVADLVSKEYNISIDDAHAMVGEFVAYMRSVLASKSKYYIDDLGMLIVDSNGAISFVAESPKPTPAPAPVVAPSPILAPIPAPMPAPAPAPQRIVPQPITYPVAPAPQPIAPQPIAPPRPGVAAPHPVAGPFARPMAPSPIPNIPSPIGGVDKPMTPPQPMQQMPQMQGQQQVNGAPMPQPQVARPQMPAPGQQRRKPQPVRKKGSKNDIWLIVAIVAAIIVVVIMVIALITTSNAEQFQIQ